MNNSSGICWSYILQPQTLNCSNWVSKPLAWALTSLSKHHWPVLLLLCFQQQLRIMLMIHLAATDIELFQLSVQASCLSPDLFVKASLTSFFIVLFSTTVADYANHTSYSQIRWIIQTECPSLLPDPWPLCQSIIGQFYYCFVFNNSCGLC